MGGISYYCILMFLKIKYTFHTHKNMFPIEYSMIRIRNLCTACDALGAIDRNGWSYLKSDFMDFFTRLVKKKKKTLSDA